MTTTPLALEWQNANSLRKYPFVDDATLVDDLGNFRLPVSFIVDLSLAVSPQSGQTLAGTNLTNFRVSAVTGRGIATEVEFSHGTSVVGTAVVSATAQPGDVVNIQSTTAVQGAITVGGIPTEVAQLAGRREFQLAATRIIPSCIFLTPRGVQSLAFESSGSRIGTFNGDLVIQLGQGILGTPSPVGTNGIRLDGVGGLNMNEACQCSDGTAAHPVTQINGVAPVNGQITLVSPDGTVQITPAGAGVVQLAVPSVKPCCTNADLERVRDDVTQLVIDAQKQSAVQSQIQTMLAILVAR